MAILRDMKRIRHATTVLAATLLTLVVTASVAFASEGGERTKIELFEGPRDVIGIVLLGGLVLATVYGVRNAVQQLNGRRDAADGKWRWR